MRGERIVTVSHAQNLRNAGLLAIIFIVLLSIVVIRFRRAARLTPLLAISCYHTVLTAFFIAGVLLDDGYGVAFLAVMVATLPSSLLLALTGEAPIMHLFFGVFGNFVLFVIIFAGLNSLFFYLIAKSVGKAPQPPPSVV